MSDREYIVSDKEERSSQSRESTAVVDTQEYKSTVGGPTERMNSSQLYRLRLTLCRRYSRRVMHIHTRMYIVHTDYTV